MHIPSLQTRLPSALFLAVFASSAAASLSWCVADASIECGANQETFARCIRAKAPAWFTVSAIQTCLSESGCSEQNAIAQAHWAVDVCGSEYQELESNEFGDTKFAAELRKRIPADDDAATTTADENEEATTTADETTTTDEATTTDETTTADETTTSDSTPSSTSTVATTVVLSASSTSASSSNTSLVCYKTVTYMTDGWDIVTTQTNGRVSRTWNSSMVAASTKCNDGLYCDGDGGCFVASNGLQGTSGLAVTIFFAAAVALSFGVLILLCCRDRQKDKKRQAEAEAAKMAREQAAAAAAVRPLIPKRVASPSPFGDRNRI